MVRRRGRVCVAVRLGGRTPAAGRGPVGGRCRGGADDEFDRRVAHRYRFRVRFLDGLHQQPQPFAGDGVERLAHGGQRGHHIGGDGDVVEADDADILRHAQWDGWAAPDDTYVVDGENVVVLARYTATNKATGKPIDVRVAHHFVVRGGLIVRFEQFVDTALVRDAMTA